MVRVATVLFAALALSTVTAQVTPAPAVQPYPAWPPVWPLPQGYRNGTKTMTVNAAGLRLVDEGGTADVYRAWSRFIDRTFDHAMTPQPGGIGSVTVFVANASTPLQLGASERYELSVEATGVRITADTVFGVYHGLETLSQLIFFDFDAKAFVIRGAPWQIRDEPRFAHRGLLIDTARHYLPLRTIYRIVETASYAKLNVIHWHMVDAQSFAFDSPSFPSLGKRSAFSAQERFTPNDVAAVVEYARQRGIRVEVELDTPGHSAAMCKAYPEICPHPWCPSKNVNNWALDITKNETYRVIEGIWADFAKLFPERLVHIGGDEVDTHCWSLRPAIVQWLKERHLTLEGGYEYFVQRVQKWIWEKMAGEREVVGWQEIWDHFGTALDKRTIIQQWLPNSVSLPLNVTSHGYRLIWSDSSVWYLDHLDVTWEKMYDAEPCNGLPDKNCKLILGGEGCQWGETVDTSDALQTIWPRAAAIAERLWSPRGTKSAAAKKRITGFRCLLNRRGFSAAPVDNAEARSAPPHPGSCYDQ